MWSTLSAKMKKQENRNTVIEKDIENLKEFKESANHRLDSHDEQNKAILVLAEQVKKCVKQWSRKENVKWKNILIQHQCCLV